MEVPKRPIIWSPEARSDLSDTWSYYERQAGRYTANRIVRGIGEACRLVEAHPFAGRSRNEVRDGLRSIVASPHVVFYRFDEHGVAEIVRVIDGRRDLDDVFGDL